MLRSLHEFRRGTLRADVFHTERRSRSPCVPLELDVGASYIATSGGTRAWLGGAVQLCCEAFEIRWEAFVPGWGCEHYSLVGRHQSWAGMHYSLVVKHQCWDGMHNSWFGKH